MSNRRRKRTGQNKIAANLKVRLDRGAAKVAAKVERQATKALITNDDLGREQGGTS
jgi:hypothetical protein